MTFITPWWVDKEKACEGLKALADRMGIPDIDEEPEEEDSEDD